MVQFTPAVTQNGCPQPDQGTVVVSEENSLAVYHNQYYDLSWIVGLSSSGVSTDTSTGVVKCNGNCNGTSNIIGYTYTEMKVSEFTFTFAAKGEFTCMGFLEKSDVSLLDVDKDLSGSSLSLCAGGSSPGLSQISGNGAIAVGAQFTVSVSAEEKSVIYRQVNGQNVYVGYYENEQDLHYSASFSGNGAIQMAQAVQYADADTAADILTGGAGSTGAEKVAVGYNFDFSWLNATSSDATIGYDTAYARIYNSVSSGAKTVGKTVSNGKVASFDFTFNDGTSCVGFVDKNGTKISLCSNNTKNGLIATRDSTIKTGSRFVVTLDPSKKTITFAEISSNGGKYTASYKSNDNLSYTAEFQGTGVIELGPSVQYFSTNAVSSQISRRR